MKWNSSLFRWLSFVKGKQQTQYTAGGETTGVGACKQTQIESRHASHEALLLETISNIIMEVDNDKVYTWANEAGIAFFGDDVVGKEASFYFEGEQETYDAVRPVFFGSEETIYVESWQRRKDGEIRLLAWHCRSLRNASGEIYGVISSATDITERKQADSALRESEEKFKRVFEAANVGKSITLLTGKINVNKAFADMLGYSEEELQSKTWQELTPPDDIEVTQRIIDRLLTGEKESDRFIKRYIHKDGSHVWADVSVALRHDKEGKPLHFLTTVIDITGRKKAEDALADEAVRRRILVDGSRDGIVVMDVDGKVVEANRKYAEMLGYTHEEVMQLDIWDWDTTFSHDIIQDMLSDVTEVGDHFETRHTRKDGTQYDVEISSNAAVINGRKLIFCVCRDITERKQAEAALRENERKLREAQEMAHLGYWSWDVKTGEVEWSEEVFRIFQLDPATFRPRIESIQALSPWPEDHMRDQELIQRAIASHEQGDYEQRFLRPDGSTAYYYSTFEGRYDDAGNLISIVGTVLDITARKLAETALRESEAKFRHVFQFSNVGKSITQLDGKLNVNKALAVMLGYTQGELRGKTWQDLTPPEDIESTQLVLEPLLSGRADSARFEKRYVHKDGTYLWGDVSVSILRDDAGKPLHFITAVVDITSRKLGELALQSLTLHQDTLLQAIPDIIMEVNNERIYTWANSAGIEFFGDDVVGKEASFYFEGEQNTYDVVTPVFNGSGKAVYVESWQRRKDGQVRLLAWSCRPLKNTAGEVTGAISSAPDITERKKAEEQIKEYQLHLEDLVTIRTEELEEKARHLSEAYAQMESFSYSVSHDLRAPLRHIQGFTEMLIRNAGDTLDAESQRLLNVVISASSEMGRLVDELLTYSRTGRAELSRQEVALDKLAQDIYEVLSPMREGREIAYNVEKLPVVVGDPALLNVVLSNLLSNAIKFTRHQEDAIISVSCVGFENGQTVIRVKDNGAGFDMRYANKLFGVFQRLHSLDEFEGNGIGLATVRQIIGRHGGRVWAEGEIGNGASFYFTLESADNHNREKRRPRE